MEIRFIRHGKTQGNQKKCYIGRTDEALCADGIQELMEKKGYLGDESPSLVLVSPMKRCVQTAEILFKGAAIKAYDGFRECDFGDFEGKNYQELSGNVGYQRWVDSAGKLPFPAGEEPMAFRRRCVETFQTVILEHRDQDELTFVIHGGTIMAILEAFAVPRRDFYEYQVENGCGFLAEYEEKREEIQIVRTLG